MKLIYKFMTILVVCGASTICFSGESSSLISAKKMLSIKNDDSAIEGDAKDFIEFIKDKNIDKLSPIQSLHLRNVNSDQLSHLVGFIRKLSGLKKLALIGDYLHVDALAVAMEKLSELTHLTLEGNFHDPGAVYLADAMSKLNKLEQVILKGIYEDPGVQAIIDSLGNHEKLTLLTLEGFYDNSSAQFIAAEIMKMVNLTHLNLKGWFREDGARVIEVAGEKLEKLIQLTLNGNMKKLPAKP